MNTEKFRDAVSGIDQELVADALENDPFQQAAVKSPRMKKRTFVLLIAAAALAIVTALSVTLVFALRQTDAPQERDLSAGPTAGETSEDRVAATVYLDAEIGVVLNVDGNGVVLSARSADPQMNALLSAMDCTGADVTKTVGRIAAVMISEGYLSSDRNALLLSIDCKDVAAAEWLGGFEDQIDAVYNVYFPEGKLLTQAYYHPATTTESLRIAQLALRYDISIANAEYVVRLLNILPDEDEETLAKMSVSALQKLCKKYGITTGSVILIEQDDAVSIAATDAGVSVKDLERLTVEYGYHKDAYALVYCIAFSRNGTRCFYRVHMTTGEIVYSMRTDKPLTEEQAKELVLLNYAIDDRWIESIDAVYEKKNGGYYAVTLKMMDFDTMRRSTYKLTVNAVTGAIAKVSKTEVDYR